MLVLKIKKDKHFSVCNDDGEVLARIRVIRLEKTKVTLGFDTDKLILREEVNYDDSKFKKEQ